MRLRSAIVISLLGWIAAAAPASADLPRTGFELRGGEGWTTPSEEETFIEALDGESDRVSVLEIGRTVEDRPLRLLVVGREHSQAEIRAGSSLLVVCTQHGDEPAPREACLQVARDHAAGTDPTTVMFIPTANPDGLVRNTSENSQGINPNRDH